MKRIIVLSTAAIALGAMGDVLPNLPRNPFWPQGYDGTRYPITTEPRIKPQTAPVDQLNGIGDKGAANGEGPRLSAIDAEALAKRQAEEAARQAAEAARQAEDRVWGNARKALKFGATLNFSIGESDRTTVIINKRSYAAGDYVSANVGEERFTWRVESITSDGKLRLKRIKHITIQRNNQK